jgi:hypothetical protein
VSEVFIKPKSSGRWPMYFFPKEHRPEPAALPWNMSVEHIVEYVIDLINILFFEMLRKRTSAITPTLQAESFPLTR